MTAPILLRPARGDEAALLSAIAQEAKAHWGYAPAVLAAWKTDLTVQLDSSGAKPAWVAEVDGAMAGFFQLRLDTAKADLDHLWVRPHSMGRGIGRALVERACAETLARGHAELHIDADPHAARFYRACGARHVGDTPAPITGDPARVRPQFVLRLRAGA